MRVEMLAVGTELLLGQIVNGNGADIGQRLAEAGLDHFRQTVVGDNLDRIVAAITEATDRADALIVTGGLGPTQDDVTREALARAAGVPLEFSDQYAAELQAWWERRGREMPSTNLRQAEYPAGSEFIANPKGTAPGLQMRIGECWVFAVPGVPQEMLPMVDEVIVPFLRKEAGDVGTVVSRVIRTWGESESRLAERLDDLFTNTTNPTLAFLASGGEIKLRLTARAADRVAADALIDPVEHEIRSRLGSLVFAVGGDSIESLVLQSCRARGWSLATAESATGGLIAAAITGVSGASDTFRGSIVSYATDTKSSLLGVGERLIDEHGVVSEPVALAMASGARGAFGADVAISVTGSAGPTALGEPAGTMVIGVDTPEGARARTLRLPGDRERVRAYTTTSALHLARLAIAGEWWKG